jgi:hypothetical protein
MINIARVTANWSDPEPQLGRMDSRSGLDIGDSRAVLAIEQRLFYEGFIAVNRVGQQAPPTFDVAWDDRNSMTSPTTRMLLLTDGSFITQLVRDDPGTPQVFELRFTFELLS